MRRATCCNAAKTGGRAVHGVSLYDSRQPWGRFTYSCGGFKCEAQGKEEGVAVVAKVFVANAIVGVEEDCEPKPLNLLVHWQHVLVVQAPDTMQATRDSQLGEVMGRACGQRTGREGRLTALTFQGRWCS